MGLGDMIRGMIWLMRLAKATKRVFLIHSTHPVDLEMLFLPANLDWRVGNISIPRCTCNSALHHKWQMFPERLSNLINPPRSLEIWSPDCRCTQPSKFMEPITHKILSFMYYRHFTYGQLIENPVWMSDESADNGTVSAVTFLIVSTNSMAHWSIPQTADITKHGIETHCIFNTLFQAAPRVESQARIFKKTLRFSEGEPYVAVHLRLGGFRGEDDVVTRHSDNDTSGVFACAARIARNHNFTAPVLLAVDNATMRKDAVAGHIPGGLRRPFEEFNLDLVQMSFRPRFFFPTRHHEGHVQFS